MKKILFVLPHMICGGVEKALLALLHELPRNEFNISVRVVKSEGDFVSLIPEFVDYGELPLPEKIRDDLMLGGIKASIRHYATTMQLTKLLQIGYKVTRKDPLATLTCDFESLEELQEKYDVAICFHIHMPFIVRYVAEKVRADVKCAWIHNDFVMSGFDVKKIESYLNKYDHYFAVSEQLMTEFITIFPRYAEKTTVAHNIVSESYIRSNLVSEKVDEYENNTINLLTIGRLDKQKGYDLAIKACKILKKKGIHFNWYVLGDGPEECNIKKQIQREGVAENFHLLGTRVNPYPYINDCDIYVQPSKHEGYGIALAEARMLNKAIVCTDFTGARDQIISGKTGTIVTMDEKEIANAINELIFDVNKRKNYIEALSKCKKESANELHSIIKYFTI